MDVCGRQNNLLILSASLCFRRLASLSALRGSLTDGEMGLREASDSQTSKRGPVA